MAKRKTRRGEVAQKTFQAVEQLVARKQVPKTEAFKEIAKRTKRTPASVAVTYYRVARQQGGTAARRDGRGGAVEAVMDRAAAVLKELRRIVRRQQREIARLREKSTWADQVRRMLRR